MRMYDIIRKKRDGLELTEAEIRWFISEYVKGSIPDYQVSALCMAIYFRGMTPAETLALTIAIRDSGERLDFSEIDGIRVDKHSTGGVGDKTTLVVAPIVASLGAKVAKVSGRGLGHTGGTVDKLESFFGFNTELSKKEFVDVVKKTGMAVIGQSGDVAPADKLLYALRDVTATVDSIPLIASSIMGKKLAADDDCIVLDVKTGSGAFMKTLEESRALAHSMLNIGKGAGKKMRVLISGMDEPLGYAIGNSLEVIEAISILNGKGPSDLKYLCTELASHMLSLYYDTDDTEYCRRLANEAICNGKALEALALTVEAQGGSREWVYDTSKFPTAEFSYDIPSPSDGYITRVNAEEYGVSALLLGAGRLTKKDKIDHAAGIILHKKCGDYIKKGESIATLYTNRKDSIATAAQRLINATSIGEGKPNIPPLIYDILY